MRLRLFSEKWVGRYMKNFPVTRNIAVAFIAFFALIVTASTLTAGTIERVSVSSEGEEGDGDCYTISVSADGRYVAFTSRAVNLTDTVDTGTYRDVFLHDSQTGETVFVSKNSDGEIANGDSYSPKISANGQFVVFHSWASNLIDGDENDYRDIFVYDRVNDELSVVSVSSSGAQLTGDSIRPSISADGQYVAYETNGAGAVTGDSNSKRDIIVYDTESGENTRVSVATDGTQSGGDCYRAVISADGRYVAFDSSGSALVDDDENEERDVFVYDLEEGTLTRISVNPETGEEGDGRSAAPSISRDGSIIVFESEATNLIDDDDNELQDVFVYNLETNELTRVSVNTIGGDCDGASSTPMVSSDGRFVTFLSDATDLVADDTNGVKDAFSYDRETGDMVLVSVNDDGTCGNAKTSEVSVNSDGQYIAITSAATNLVDDDTNSCTDVFLVSTGITPSTNYILEILASPDTAGIVSPSGDMILASSEEITIQAAALSGYHFSNWEYTGGAVIGSEDSAVTTLSVYADATVTAIFEEDDPEPAYLTVEMNIEDSATTYPSGVTEVEAGVETTIYAVAETGYHFVEWEITEGEGELDNPEDAYTTITFTGTVTVTAIMAANGASLTVSASPSSGGITNPSGSTSAEVDEVVTVVAAALSGYRFVRWECDDNCETDSAELETADITVLGDAEVTAIFARDDLNDDFDGDGQSDVLFFNEDAGSAAVRLIQNGEIVQEKQLFSGVYGWYPMFTCDMNNDQMADIVFRNPETGGVYVLVMNGVKISSSKQIIPSGYSDYQLICAPDLNGDNRHDLVFRNDNNGAVYGLLMNGCKILSQDFILESGYANWEFQTHADLKGNGYDDLVFRDTETGAFYALLMSGLVISSGDYIYEGDDPDWEAVGSGDFDGDGKSDLVLRHAEEGSVFIRLMNGLTTKSGNYVYNGGDLNWDVTIIRDLDGDAKDDLVLWNAEEGGSYVYLMDGDEVADEGYIEDSGDPDWIPLLAGDYNGDGQVSIIYGGSDGSAEILTLDGVTPGDPVDISAGADGWVVWNY